MSIKWSELYLPFRIPLFLWIGVVLLIWLASAALIFYSFQTWPERGQFGDLFGAVNSLFSGLAFAGVVIALLLQNHGLQHQLDEVSKAHDWNRRKLAYDLIFEASLGKFGELRRGLEVGNIYDQNQTFTTQALSEEKLLQLDAALNFLENVCLSIKNNVVDEGIVYDALGEILVAYFRWARPYINDCRSRWSDDFWSEIDPYEDRWRQKAVAARVAAREARQQPGRPRL